MGTPPASWQFLQPVAETDLSPTWLSYPQQGSDPIEEVCRLPEVAFVPKDAAWTEVGPRDCAGHGTVPKARVGYLLGAGAGRTEEAEMF